MTASSPAAPPPARAAALSVPLRVFSCTWVATGKKSRRRVAALTWDCNARELLVNPSRRLWPYRALRAQPAQTPPSPPLHARRQSQCVGETSALRPEGVRSCHDLEDLL